MLGGIIVVSVTRITYDLLSVTVTLRLQLSPLTVQDICRRVLSLSVRLVKLSVQNLSISAGCYGHNTRYHFDLNRRVAA